MYRIKNDKRVRQSAELIREGLFRCLREKGLDQIGVSEIASASGVSRGTFYRIFDTPVDVLAYACDTLTAKAQERFARSGNPVDDKAFLFWLRFWLGESEVLEALYRSGRTDILEKSLYPYFKSFRPEPLNAFTDTEMEYIGIAAASFLGGILTVWIRHGRKESPEELFGLYQRFLAVFQLPGK